MYNSKEPIKSWSSQWMIENNLQYPFLVPTSFKKTEQEKVELANAKIAHKKAVKLSDYKANQVILLGQIAKSHPRFNIVVSHLNN